MATAGTPGEDHNIIARAGPGGVHVGGYARLEDNWDAQLGLLDPDEIGKPEEFRINPGLNDAWVDPCGGG